MKYALDTVLMNLDGKTPMKDGQGEALTFKAVSALALVQSPDKDAAEKYKSFALAVKLESANANAIELGAEEVARIKRLVGELMPPIVVGRMFDLLDQKQT